MTTPDQQHGTPDEPPSSQQEVIASALADIGRFVADARQALDRALAQEGEVGDALRAAQGTFREWFEAGKRTAQYEHTLLVTDDGVDVLTAPGSVSPHAPRA